MTQLVLYGESGWVSPWVFHAMVALEEKGLPYQLELVPLPIPADTKAMLRARSVIGKVPILVHGDLWLTESLAISEYLAETFRSTDGYPRLFPADLAERARARQIMSMLRTGWFGLREDRPTSSVFGVPVTTPLSAKGASEAAELLRCASAFIPTDRTQLFETWCIADADLALMLMRLVNNGDPVDDHVAAYARAQWERPSVQKYVAAANAR
ncbi:MAG: glutathione transferase [Proteobacteria bacterium]|nr:glutathione transferase [Pseudomonadota bacterium]